MADAYDDIHRKFLQGMMCRKVCNSAEVRELFNLCCGEVDDRNFANAIVLLIRDINRAIMPFHMEIRKGIDEEDGTHLYALINCYEGPLSLSASEYTAVELEYFQKLIAAAVQSDNGVVSSISALNLLDDLGKPMSKDDGQDLLERLAHGKWITQNNGKISLSALTIMEFTQYIKEMFPDDVTQCHLCKQLILKGENCVECETKLHFHCIARLFKDKDRAACPRCSAVLLRNDDRQAGTSRGRTRQKKQSSVGTKREKVKRRDDGNSF